MSEFVFPSANRVMNRSLISAHVMWSVMLVPDHSAAGPRSNVAKYDLTHSIRHIS